jgi:LysM repeat protein
LKLKQKLTILPVSGIRYLVKTGDTLLSIAEKTGSDIDKIISFNEIENNLIKPGQKLIIPGGKIIGLPNKSTKNRTKARSYSVAKKQTLKISTNKLSKIFIRPSVGRATSPYGRR